MKKLFALGVILTGFLLSASIASAGEIGEALTEEQNPSEETSTLPPHAGELGEPQYEELGEGEVHHEVKKGDTLWKIAGYYHVDFKEVLRLNDHLQDPNLIYPKELIELPNNQVQGIQEAYFNY
jgi:LysM repeat protein